MFHLNFTFYNFSSVQIKETIDEGLVIFCWGDDNNSTDNIRLLKNLGLHAIIYDKMDTLSTKERRVSRRLQLFKPIIL